MKHFTRFLMGWATVYLMMSMLTSEFNPWQWPHEIKILAVSVGTAAGLAYAIGFRAIDNNERRRIADFTVKQAKDSTGNSAV